MKNILILSFLLFSFTLMAQSPEGVWVTIDDESNEPKSHVKIYEKDGKYFGKVVKLLPAAKNTKCNECEGDKKGADIEGMQILWDLEPYKDYYSYGEILDPTSGKEYKCSMWVEDDKLKVRGYIGISAFGRTQIWERLN